MKSADKHNAPLDLIARVLSGEAADSERREFEDWRMQSDENNMLFTRYSKLWERTGKIPKGRLIDVNVEWNEFMSRTQKGQDKQGKKVILQLMRQLAAAIIIGIVGGSVAFLSYQAIRFDRVVARSEVTEVLLPDSSMVTLNLGSRLIYPKRFRPGSRIVSFSGEGFFDINSDPLSPFAVKSGKVFIEVLGTSFNVEAQPGSDLLNIVVSEGTVAVYRSSAKENAKILLVGDRLIYDKTTNEMIKSPNEDVNFDSWKTRIISFESSNMKEVAATLSKVFFRNIEVSGSQLEEERITVTFKNKELDYILETISTTIGFEVKDINGTLVFSK